MNISKKTLFVILLTQVLILGIAFFGFSIELEKFQRDREARVFEITTNLQYTSLLDNPENSVADAMLGTLRHISQMPGIIGARLFNEKGEQVLSIPEIQAPQDSISLTPEASATLHSHFPLNQLDPAVSPEQREEVLQLDIPLKSQGGDPVAFIRFYRDGSTFASTMYKQKGALALLAFLAILLVSGVTTFLFTSYDRKLKRTQNILRAKNEELINTQNHLLLSSKMTATGSMTAHLVHDLKSYTTRILQTLKQAANSENKSSQELQDSLHNASEMESRIREFLTILKSDSYEFQERYNIDEILDITSRKLEPVAHKANLTLEFNKECPSFHLDFNQGNFLILILQNLLHNAIESSPSEQRVTLTTAMTESSAEFYIKDRGPGIPEEQQKNLFSPQGSFKAGGTGMGLALCAQMAYHIGAEISLDSSSPQGAVFKISIPLKKLVIQNHSS